MQGEMVMNPLTSPDSDEVVAALALPCECGAKVDEFCWDATVRKSEEPRRLHESPAAGGRLVHFARLASAPAPAPRKPRTRKPVARMAPVSAAKPIVVDAKDVGRKRK